MGAVDNALLRGAVSDSVSGMRWEDLFTDLEGQLESEFSSEESDLRAEEERLRLARLGVRDRLLAVHTAGPELADRLLRVNLRDGTRLAVTPTTFGRDWFVADLHGEMRRERPCIVPLDAIASVSFTAAQVYASLDAPPPDDKRQSLASRLGLGFVPPPGGGAVAADRPHGGWHARPGGPRPLRPRRARCRGSAARVGYHRVSDGALQ
jgi:hypothetical protein